jgi:hypothetical protein
MGAFQLVSVTILSGLPTKNNVLLPKIVGLGIYYMSYPPPAHARSFVAARGRLGEVANRRTCTAYFWASQPL